MPTHKVCHIPGARLPPPLEPLDADQIHAPARHIELSCRASHVGSSTEFPRELLCPVSSCAFEWRQSHTALCYLIIYKIAQVTGRDSSKTLNTVRATCQCHCDRLDQNSFLCSQAFCLCHSRNGLPNEYTMTWVLSTCTGHRFQVTTAFGL